MPIVSTGDMALQFQSLRNGGLIKSDLGRATQELSTGRIADIPSHLGGDTRRLSGLEHSLAKLDGYLQVSREAAQTLSSIQNVLTRVDDIRGEAANHLLLVSNSSSHAQVSEAANVARHVFDDLVGALNSRSAGRGLMGGVEFDGPVLADAGQIVTSMVTAVGTATVATQISDRIDHWFDDPVGGFQSTAYLGGDSTGIQTRLSDDKVVVPDVTANDPKIRGVLKAAAYAVVVAAIPALDQEAKAELMQKSGAGLIGAASGVAEVQSRIGYVEGEVERAMTENASRRTILGAAKNDLISADPFETASRLQGIQLQLETHYSMTARLSRLSLLDYI